MSLFKKLFHREPKPGEPVPTTDEAFAEDVLASDVPVVVDFWSPTCAPCQVLGGLLRDVGPEFAGRVKIFKLNVTENPETARKFRVSSVPTMVFVKNQRMVDHVVGVVPLNTLRQKFEKLVA